MKVVRVLAIGVIVSFAIYALNHLAWQPYRCNQSKKVAQSVLFETFDLPSSPMVIALARENLSRMEQCVEVVPGDVDMRMTVAGFQRLLGRKQDALMTYRLALNYDRRPEIFLNIGLVELELGRPDEALDPLVKATLFNINFINEIPEGYRGRVARALGSVETRELHSGPRSLP